MRNVTITIYSFDELDDSAKQKAAQYSERDLYECEWDWVSMAISDYEKAIQPHAMYSHDELPRNICLHFNFADEYKYHGARMGKFILQAFREFCDSYMDHRIFDEEEISEYASGNEMEFDEYGNIFRE